MAHRMLTAEREQRILQLLKGQEVISVAVLKEKLGTSEATVRRDLQSMHERGLLERLRGGAAVKSGGNTEPLFADKADLNGDAKQRIAEAALALIHDHDTIFLDGGSTVLRLAKLLEARKDLTVVTDSLMAASALMETGHRLILPGGEFRAISRTLVGPLSAAVMGEISVDKAFMGTYGYTVKDGMSTTDPNEAFTKEQAMRRARSVILLADHTKLGWSSFVKCSCDHLDVLVTDEIKDDIRKELEEKDVKILLA